MKQSNYISALLITCIMLAVSNDASAKWLHTKTKSTQEVAQETFSTYTTLQNAYMPILQAYDLVTQSATICERSHYVERLCDVIRFHVQQNLLSLNGNVFNKMWRSATSYNTDYPLKRFESTLVADTIGHMNKAYKKMAQRGSHNGEIELFISKLEHIKALVRSTAFYAVEEMKIENERRRSRLIIIG